MDDQRLRRHGFVLHGRAKGTEPIWQLWTVDKDGNRVDGGLYGEAEALAKCDRMDREPPPAHKKTR